MTRYMVQITSERKREEAMFKYKDRHEFAKWWSGFKDSAREFLPPEYYAEVLVPVIKDHAATLAAASDKKDAA
jgi:hypothetical protein